MNVMTKDMAKASNQAPWKKYVEKIEEEAADTISSPGEELYLTLRSALSEIDIRATLPSANILIFGVVGFFNPICEALIQFYDAEFGKKVKFRRVHMNSVLSSDKTTVTPLIMLPTAENSEQLNKLIAKGLNTGRPVWLIGLPSQIESNLLSAFNCFFIAPRPSHDVKLIMDITPVLEEDVKELNGGKLDAILAIDKKTPSLGISDRMGTVIYIDKLS